MASIHTLRSLWQKREFLVGVFSCTLHGTWLYQFCSCFCFGRDQLMIMFLVWKRTCQWSGFWDDGNRRQQMLLRKMLVQSLSLHPYHSRGSASLWTWPSCSSCTIVLRLKYKGWGPGSTRNLVAAIEAMVMKNECQVHASFLLHQLSIQSVVLCSFSKSVTRWNPSSLYP